ncbi:MAG: Arsenic efflux pump protein [Candidatus Carbobacillus altaicus]|uniref:Arsenical pump membrane protein n=1 Tax=Candidatus Carbonibacillus altaicus TaxID=2163959 RepID=A0A2R6XXL2_9BACL|nr:MAG: Arsenic efflux pump protein [Candidatus Carbobacillus altaicus]
MIALALLIFFVTLLFVLIRPWNLSIGTSALAGATLAMVFGVVSWADVLTVVGIVWNATLTFVGMMIISLVLDEIGFFEWAALNMARWGKGSGFLLYGLMIVLGAFVAAFFANDGAALILTPIVLAMVRHLGFGPMAVLAFVMGGGFIADTTSLPFVISNLVNIVSADYFNLGFVEYSRIMLIPNAAALVASLVMLMLYYWRVLPRRYDPSLLALPKMAIRDPHLFRWSWWVLGFLLIAYFGADYFRIPVSLLVLPIAFLYLGSARRSPAVKPWKILKEAPWAIVVFSIGMYVVVYGLKNAGITNILSTWIEQMAATGLTGATVGMGFLAAILSSVMNNMPTVMINALSIQHAQLDPQMQEAMVYANVVGADLGPKLTPIGSLATLLWMNVLAKKQVVIGWWTYMKTGFVLTIPTLLATLLALSWWLQVNL